MQNYEHSLNQPEYASQQALHDTFTRFAEAIPTHIHTHDPQTYQYVIAPSTPAELDPYAMLDSIRAATNTPFQEIESVVVSHLAPDYDDQGRNGGTIYPETIAVTLHGYYGDIDVAERSISYVIAPDELTGDMNGFAVQHFHETGSYMFADPLSDPHHFIYTQPTELLRTIAANLDDYQSFIDDRIAYENIGTSEDMKRTAELRPLDTNDLLLFQSAYKNLAPALDMPAEA